MHLLPSDVAAAAAGDGSTTTAASRLIAGARVVLTQLEVPRDTTLAAMRAGRAAGAVTIFTPAPTPPPSDPLPTAFYAATDVLVPNRTEALQLAASVTADAAQAAAFTAAAAGGDAGSATREQLAEAAVALCRAGCGAVVITLGSHGSLVLLAGEAAGDAVHVPAVRVPAVVDTTGAGDSFSGALAYFYSRLRPAAPATTARGVAKDALLDAARRAAYVAAVSVTRKGTQSSYARVGDGLLPPALFDLSAPFAAAALL